MLAFLGDAVYELLVRTGLVLEGNRPVRDLHDQKVSFVRAEKQALLAALLQPELTAEERAVMKRGRNAHSHTAAKSASVEDYRHATGFEALLGYLWLTGQQERILCLAEKGLSLAAGREE